MPLRGVEVNAKKSHKTQYMVMFFILNTLYCVFLITRVYISMKDTDIISGPEMMICISFV